MRFMKHTRRARPALWLAAAMAVGVAGCSGDNSTAPPADNPLAAAGDLTLGLQASSKTAKVGDQVAVAIAATSKLREPLIALQGFVRFDASKLEYVGHASDAGIMVAVNDKAASSGELRLLSLNVSGLKGTTSRLIFKVKAAGYASSLKYTLEEAATSNLTVKQATVRDQVQEASVALTTARRESVADWTADLEAAGYVKEPVSDGRHVASLYPGSSSRFGDINLTGTVAASDVAYMASLAVGLNQLADPAANRDGSVAGNVTPNNLPGLGEPGDTCRPGATCSAGVETAPGDITAADVGQVAQEAVGLDRPVVGEIIPGRTTVTDTVAVAAGTLTGTINWTADHVYRLDGIVRIGTDDNSGAAGTLNIAPGTKVAGNSTVGVSALFIQRKGQIFAEGTPLSPIVFTCTAAVKSKGCWGGIYIAGNAPINTPGTGLGTSPAIDGRQTGGGVQNQGEGGAPIYGGNNPDDNSGSLKYARVEYAGFILSPNNELNGLTLGGVGRGTTFDYIELFGGLDDGIEFFGGTANVKHIASIGNSDDSFDTDFGWNGSAQFVLIQQDSLDSDKGIESDNSALAADYSNAPRTAPTLYNFTIIGKKFGSSASFRAGSPGAANNSEAAFNIRRGAGGDYQNFLVFAGDRGMDLDDTQTCTGINTFDPAGGAGSTPTGFRFQNSVFAGIPNLGEDDADVCAPYTSPEAEEGFIQDAANNNTVIPAGATADALMINPFNVFAPDVRPRAGSAAATGGVAAPAGNTFIQTVTYRGAVPPATSLTLNNVVWYMGWTRGWQSEAQP